LTTEKQLEKDISDIVGVFTDPILVFPGGWGDTLPEWLKETITLERLVMNMRALKGEEIIGTDAEACVYLYTVSLTQPMDSDWSEIYLYIAGKVYEKHHAKESGATMPQDIRVDQLSNYQMQHLDRLKEWIYRQRVKVRQERDHADRRERKEADLAEKIALQPALFDL